MTIEPPLGEVRGLVRRIFRQLGVPEKELWEMAETVRIHRQQRGLRRYHAGDYTAVWHRDEGLVRFWDPDDGLVRVVNLWMKEEPRVQARLQAA